MQIGFLNYYASILQARGERATLIANNIANANTPSYKATDLPFEAAFKAEISDQAAPSQPISEVLSQLSPEYRANLPVGLDGNDGSLDFERIELAQNGEALMGAATFLHQSTADLVMALRPNPGGN
ncbi:MAG: hypothetical protein B7Z71_12870 [Acidocella sp. 21-58-7]|nr:MAG: hypothetical protein B7Z71_12870 [Acidocella sp. 21-58-7]